MDEPRQTGPRKPLYGPGSNFKGKPGRTGAKPDNANAQRHGMRGGKLPKGCQYIENRVNALRRQVEAAIIEARGQITIVDAAAVNSILKWERHGLLAAHWLRREADKLSAGDRLRFSEAIAKASDNRDKNIRALGLDRDAADSVLDALYARPRASLGEPAAGSTSPQEEGGDDGDTEGKGGTTEGGDA